jgi:hypothetical protein
MMFAIVRLLQRGEANLCLSLIRDLRLKRVKASYKYTYIKSMILLAPICLYSPSIPNILSIFILLLFLLFLMLKIEWLNINTFNITKSMGSTKITLCCYYKISISRSNVIISRSITHTNTHTQRKRG